MATSDSGYVFDQENAAEMARLIKQDRLATRAAGGILTGIAEQEMKPIRSILDLACGPGGWVLDVAFAYPDIEVYGFDISETMIDYATARARSQGIKNGHFGLINIKKRLDFDDESFDMVNTRFLFAVLKREEWQPFIEECTRILRSGGILRFYEAINVSASNSPALTRFTRMFTRALWRAGYGLSLDEESLDSTFRLPSLLRELGYQQVRYAPSGGEYSIGTEDWDDNYHNYEMAYYAAIPLLLTTGVATREEAEQCYQRMLIEMNDEHFACTTQGASVWGHKG